MLRNKKGAALVEYMPLLAMLAIALPGVFFLGGQVPGLFDEPGPFSPPGTPVVTELVVPDCVMNAQCDIPTEVVEYCLENASSGEVCPIIPYLVIDTPEVPILVPTNVTDPQLPWVMEDRDLGVYANSFGDTVGNNFDIMAFSNVVPHPAGEYCNARGALLPSQQILTLMAPYFDELNLVNNLYLSSSQYWAAGAYNPPPVLVPISYAKTFAYSSYNSGVNPDGHGFLTNPFYVRCVWAR